MKNSKKHSKHQIYSRRRLKAITLNSLIILLPFLLLSMGAFAQYGMVNSADSGNDYILQNKDIKVTLSGQMPIIKEYLLKTTTGVLMGGIGRYSQPRISFYQGAVPVYRVRTKILYKPSYENNKVTYHVNVLYENKLAIEFDLIYSLQGNSLEIAFKNVVEHKGFYLLNVELPDLMTVEADNINSAKLIIPADAGRMIDVKNASFGNYDYSIDWENPILAGFAYNAKVIGILRTKSIENNTSINIYENGGKKYGSFSMMLMYRKRVYDLPGFETVIAARDPQYFLKVQDSCKLAISIGGDNDGDGKVTWMDGAEIYRKDVHATPYPFYRDKTFVREFLARKGWTGEDLSFDDVLDRIKKFAAQTDSAAYIIYLLGWQYKGHDSGFPSVAVVNKNLGGYEKLINLFKEAKKYNVTISFSDNYDDSYPTHPGWDSTVICRDPLGNLMTGGTWDGDQSYLISPYKYAIKSGLARVRFTLKRYPIENTYFIDAFSGGWHGGRNYDFNPQSPAGAEKNWEGKLMILHEFNKHGINVMSEDFTGYWVGHVGSFRDVCAIDNIHFRGEMPIPLIPFIYHGKTSYGLVTSSPSEYVESFLYGEKATDFATLRSVFTPSDYILNCLPKEKLYGKTMKSYSRDGDDQKVIYEDGTTVEVNVKDNTYSVTLGNGEVIARNYTSFVPVAKDVYMVCSKNGGVFSFPIPTGWVDRSKIHVFLLLNGNGSKTNIPFKLSEGDIEFDPSPAKPYKVIYQ